MIISLEDFPKLREEKLQGKTIVATSGFFDPLHPGHASMIVDSKRFGDVLVVIVNGNQQCVTKKGKPFMAAVDRENIVNCLKGVDFVVRYDHPTKYHSCEPIEIIKPHVFTKGGDRDTSKVVPEFDTVERNGGRVEFNVGDPKAWSSSNYLKDWEEFVKNRKD